METKYESKFTKINIDSTKSYIEIIRMLETAYMTEDDYIEDVKHWIAIIKELKPKHQLVDDRDMKFVISPSFQIWVNKNLIVPAVESGLRKVAFLESPELFSQVSIEQTMDENEDAILKLKYFEDETKAKEWLFG